MIRRFAIVWALLSAATAYSQQTPAEEQPPTQQPTTQQPTTQQPATQQPATQQPATGQEPPEEETGRRRKVRPHDYLNWTFNVGVGVGWPSGTTRTYVKGGGAVGTAGVARDFSRYFGLRADFLYANLPLRSSALELAQAPGSRSQV